MIARNAHHSPPYGGGAGGGALNLYNYYGKQTLGKEFLC